MLNQGKIPNILVVDDNLANLQILVTILEEHNYLARPINSGILALKAARISPPDLILLDVMMPEMDGYEVCERLKADEQLCDIPIIFISALNDISSKVEGFRVGGADYITKPFQAAEVIARINIQLEIQKLRQLDKLNIERLSQEIEVREQIEEALRISETRLRDILANVSDGIIVMDMKQHILLVNREAESIFAYQTDELLGKSLEILLPKHLRFAHQSHMQKFADESISRRLMKDRELNIFGCRKDGEIFPIEVSISKLNFEGELIFTAVIRDITERKQVEQQALELAIEKGHVRILSDFIRDATHEFKTPLAIIQTSLYLLEKARDIDTQQKQKHNIRKAANDIHKLVETLISILRLEELSQFELIPVNLNDMIRHVISTLRGALEKKYLILQIQLDDRTSFVEADAKELTLALTSLLDNAIRFTPSGGTITIHTEYQDDNLVISIKDTGIGIAEDVLPHIFKRLYRSDEAHTTRGLGLGLPIVQKIIELHKGNIEVESELGQGSTFRITLPIPTSQRNHEHD